MYRYYGTYDKVLYNYICFGTTDVNQCKTNPDTYMYRIIGVTDGSKMNTNLGLAEGQLKIIKATPVKYDDGVVKNVTWASDGTTDINWDHEYNTVRNYLNDTFLTTIDKTWQKIISSPKWYIGDNPEAATTTTEVKTPSIGKYRVGLMYASDYRNSWDYIFDVSNYFINDNSWLNIRHGTSSSSVYRSTIEWTMTRGGYYYPSYYAWYVKDDGDLGGDPVNMVMFTVRPVFYLIQNITLSGEGSESNPFIINS